MCRKTCFAALSLSILFFFRVEAQRSVVFYDVIRHDSILFYFNERSHFIEKNCAEFTRFVKINAEGRFNGPFVDRDQRSNLKGKGTYADGVKDGYFESYYSNGQLKEKRQYSKNIPVGQWESFYENGLPERTIKFTGTDTLLVRLVDPKGNVTVIEGNGKFKGRVSGLQGATNEIVATGTIVNGKPDGKWTSVLGKLVYCKETYKNGKLTKGTFPNARMNANYTSGSHLNRFILPDYMDGLEKIVVESCSDSLRYQPRERQTLDLNNFSSEFRRKVDRVLEDDIKSGETQDYSVGDHFLTIKFSINENGGAYDFRQVTSWGRQYYHAITSSIRAFVKFPSAQKEYYFHFKLSLTGGGLYRYNYSFSRNLSNGL